MKHKVWANRHGPIGILPDPSLSPEGEIRRARENTLAGQETDPGRVPARGVY